MAVVIKSAGKIEIVRLPKLTRRIQFAAVAVARNYLQQRTPFAVHAADQRFFFWFKAGLSAVANSAALMRSTTIVAPSKAFFLA
jgi:hypothetical protein